jgi:colanic acid/amylovoran biosynthesis protein
MGINFIHHFSSLFDRDITYIADLITDEDLRRLQVETLDKYDVKRLSSTTRRKLLFGARTRNRIRDILSHNPLGVIVLGGDDFSELYGRQYYNQLLSEFYTLYRLSEKTPLFLASQSIGPFLSWREPLARICMKKCNIYTREPISTRYLKRHLRLRNVFESSDLAFLDLPRQNSRDVLTKYNLSSDTYITIVPSGLVTQYTANYLDYVATWRSIIRHLLDSPTLKSQKIVLLPHVLKPSHVDDREVIHAIGALFSEHGRIVRITDSLYPSEARAILGNGLFALTGRMHAALSTFQMLKPAVSLSYSPKYEGVIGEMLGMSDLIVEASEGDLWGTNQLLDLVSSKIDLMLLNYRRYLDRIARAVEKNKVMAQTQLDDIAQKLERLIV